MNKLVMSGSWLLLVFILLASACAPAAPAPSPAPVPQAPQAAPALTPEEAAWAQVVAAAKKDGKLVAYSYHLIGDIGLRVKRAFAERIGIDVELISSTGTLMIERIKAERRAGFQVASILTTASTLIQQAKIEGLTEVAGPLPEVQNKEVWKESPIYDKEGHILASGLLLYNPWVNTKLVKPGEEPKSYRDLLDPKWKKKIGIGDPDTDPTSIWIYYTLVKKHGILDDAYFRQLGKSAVLYPNVRLSAEAVAKGEVDITFVGSATNLNPMLLVGAPVKPIDMEEGAVAARTTATTFLSRAPHPNAARVFVNWWLSREGQHIFHEAQGTESVRKDVPNFIPALGRLTPKKVLWFSAEDEMELARLQRERVVKNLLLGR